MLKRLWKEAIISFVYREPENLEVAIGSFVSMARKKKTDKEILDFLEGM